MTFLSKAEDFYIDSFFIDDKHVFMKIAHVIRRINVAMGKRPADLLLKNARVVSVFMGRVERADVAVADGVIVGFGAYKAKRTLDLKGAFLTSGFVDSHMHIESTLLTPAHFASVVVPKGTTTVVADPHEIANVMGLRGIDYMLRASGPLPLDIYIALPSCVPATNLETSGARLGAASLRRMAYHKRVIGIGEVMDWPGVIHARRDLLEKLIIKRGMRVDGHAPGVTGKELNAYIMGNISSDHESTRASEALEKLRDGLHIMIREGSGAKNLAELAKIVRPFNSHRMMLCTDDRNPSDLLKEGHMDHVLRKAVRLGIPPLTAIQMATNHPSYYFRFPLKKGAVAVGYQADLVVMQDLRRFKAEMVFKDGHLVAKNGELVKKCRVVSSGDVRTTMNVKDLTKERLKIRSSRENIRVIELMPHQLTTKERIFRAKRDISGNVVSDTGRDILKLVVVERHKGTGNIGIGFVKGFGLKRGALASSIAHDSHNIIAVGVDDADIFCAVNSVISSGGGLAIADRGRVIDILKLPVAGLMSDMRAEDVAAELVALGKIAKGLGSTINEPFQVLSFLALPVIPELKLTDLGLVDVRKMRHVDLCSQ